jgi:RecA-family ATPase
VLPLWIARVRFWQAPEDLDAKPKPVAMAVDTLIQRGKVGALVAAGGVGKTTLMTTLACCHATGRQFLGMRVEQGSFVLLSADDSQEDLDAALGQVVRAMKLTPQEVEKVRQHVRVVSLQGEPGTRTFATTVGGSVMPTGMVEFVLKALAGIDDLVGVAFDTLRQFAGGSSNDEEIVKATISGATEIAALTGAYVLLSHHTGKNNYRDGVTDMYVGSGSAAIADNCRFVLLLQTAMLTPTEN